jgi:putative membrane protein
MRWVYLTVIGLFAAAIIVFAFQNLQPITMSFLGFRIHAPLALLTVIVYVLGAVTGSSLFAALRGSLQGARPVRLAALR